MKITLAILVALSAFLGYRVMQLERALDQLQTNVAIAVLSAEVANKKIGAIAPWFAQDKEAFANAWLDSVNMPPAVLPPHVLVPIKEALEQRRATKGAQDLKASTFR